MRHGSQLLPWEMTRCSNAEFVLREGLINLRRGFYEVFSIDCYMFEDAMQYLYANYADRDRPKEMYDIDEWLAALPKQGITWWLEGGINDEGELIFKLLKPYSNGE